MGPMLASSAKLLAQGLRQIGHLREIGDEALIEPVIDLFGPKCRLSMFHKPLLQLWQREGQQVGSFCWCLWV